MKRLIWVAMLVCALVSGTVTFSVAQGAAAAMQEEKAALIDINRATVKQLQALPGIGKVTAQKILEYRQENGDFTRVEDLVRVQGIGKKTLEKISALVTIESTPLE